METMQQFYEGKRVLVTGGAGFIGSHLVEKLVGMGARVTILDNFTTGSLRNLKTVVHALNILYADVRSSYSCLKASFKQDIIFHLAALISVPESVNNPDLCYQVNIDGTRNMLEASKKNLVPTFVYVSSSAVYGAKNGICEETDVPNPQSPYAISKYRGEELCQHYTRTYGMNTAILRYFNVYGQRQNPNGLYAAVRAKFAHLLRAGQPLTIYGDGTQTRDFVNVTHVVNANLAIGMHNALYGEIFNVASGKSICLLELITQLEQELGIKHTELVFEPTRPGDIAHSYASVAKLQKLQLPHLINQPGLEWQKAQKTVTI